MKLKEKLGAWLSGAGYDKSKTDLYVILFYVTVMLLFFRYAASAGQFSFWFPETAKSENGDLYRYLFQFVNFFFLALVLPVLYIKLKMKEPLSSFGVTWGDKKKNIKIMILFFFILVIPASFSAALSPGTREYYPLAKIILEKPELFWIYELGYGGLYFPAWEFFFRGVVLFGLARYIGAIPAILIQTMASALVHIGTPAEEVAAAIFGGVLMGFIAWETKSMFAPLVLHMSLAVFKDYILTLIK